MEVTITLPDGLERHLRRAADAQGRTTEEVALEILRGALLAEPDDRDEPNLDVLVATIRATPPNPNAVRPARGSLADALADMIPDESFDLADGEAAWVVVEDEMASLTRADDRAEGHA